MWERKIKYKQQNQAKDANNHQGKSEALATLDTSLGDIWRLLDDTGPGLSVWPTAAGCRGHRGSKGEVWERRPGAVVRHWTALLLDGDLKVGLAGSHKGGHARQKVGAACPHVAEVLFAFNVPLPPVGPALSKKIIQKCFSLPCLEWL